MLRLMSIAQQRQLSQALAAQVERGLDWVACRKIAADLKLSYTQVPSLMPILVLLSGCLGTPLVSLWSLTGLAFKRADGQESCPAFECSRVFSLCRDWPKFQHQLCDTK